MGVRTAVLLTGLLLGIWAQSAPVGAQEPGATVPPDRAPEQARIRKAGPHLYAVGTLEVESLERTVRCRGRVNMDRGGPIELLACLPRGKTHESVFTLDAEPMDLQLALLLLGMRQGINPAVEYPADSPERARPAGDEAAIFVEWRSAPEGGQEPALERRRAEEFLLNVETERPAERAEWVFLGSVMVGGRFGADVDGSLITTYHDPLAILELALPTVNDDVYYVVNEEVCPPVGTPVELVIRAPSAEGEDGRPADALEDANADQEEDG